MRLIEDQLYKEQDKISQFSRQNIHLQSENEKIAELRKLEKKNHDLKSTSDLGAKVWFHLAQRSHIPLIARLLIIIEAQIEMIIFLKYF